MLFFDFETTNIRYGTALDERNSIVMVAWAEDSGPVKTYIGDIMQAHEFWKAVHKHKAFCAFNAKFEMHWMKRCGFDIDSVRWHDPMLAEKVLLGNIFKPLNLGDVSERYGYKGKDPLIDSLMKAGVCPSEMPQKRLARRARRDVSTMRLIFGVQKLQLQERKQIHLYRNRCDFASVLTHIEAEGMQLDPAAVRGHYERYVQELARLTARLDKMTGGINMNSSDQKAHFLYGKLKFPEKCGAGNRPLRNKPSKQFPNGRPKTDKDTLTWLMTQAKTAKQRDFVGLSKAYSKCNAAVSKNLQFFQGICEEYDGKFKAQFNQIVAATHRLTSSGLPLPFELFEGKEKSVQFQNMPREFKNCFDAPEGYKVTEVDAMQLEFRVAAFLGQDKQAMRDIADPDFDAHIYSASEINELDYDYLLAAYRNKAHADHKKAKALRQAAKPHTFKPLYGGTKGTEGEERYYKKFAERYKGVAAVQENWLADVMRTGQVITGWNMRFSFKTYVDRRGVAMNKLTHKPVGPQVANYPVQNLATAEIVPIAIVALYKECKERNIDVKFVNTVHDSVICYVKDTPGEITAFRQVAEWAFTIAVYEHLKLFYNIEFNVPLGMEMVIGDHWSEGMETIYDDVKNRRKAA
jgi:DNA polymerase I-like protein with 3'-5' exonuclease and polymerase domains